jgi:hypothetical protein
MIDASRFRRPQIDERPPLFPFAIGNETNVAAVLREFADAVERGDFIVERVQTGQVAQPDEYVRSAMLIEYVAKVA